MMMRTLGRSGVKVSALGLGGRALGEQVDEDESVRTIHRALQLGIDFFDTADVYGGGRGERVLGRALRANRDEVVIATKWGHTFDASTGAIIGQDASPAYLRRAVEASLRRLQTDRIDLYQLHLGELPTNTAAGLLDPLERLVTEGKIRWYGWSTDVDDRAAAWGSDGPHCTAIQHDYSVGHRSTPDVLAVCEALELASVVRRPLDTGALAGAPAARDRTASGDPAANGNLATAGGPPDRARSPNRPHPPSRPHASSPRHAGSRPRAGSRLRQRLPLGRRSGIQEVLTSDGRTAVQGALAWLWARSPATIPIPGCRNVAQVEEAVEALRQGPLHPSQMETIAILSDLDWPGRDRL